MNYRNYIDQYKVFQAIAEAGNVLGYDTYLVGGFVRDLLLERDSKDVDVVCVGSGINLAKEVAKRFKAENSLAVYKNFGTAMLQYGDMEIEFVGARKESYRKDSRKPVVEDGTLEDDQNRRDFTINALAISLNDADYGELIDPFNGLEDLKDKLIRTPTDPETTFSDDPLRMMRAIRFASQLSFDIEPDTFEFLCKNKERINIVSQERITTELNKIIESPVPSYGFKLLFHSGLLHLIFPEMVDLQGVETREGKSHKDNFYHTLQVLDNVAKMSDDLWLRWAAILHDIAKPKTKRFDKKAGWTFHGHDDLGAKMTPKIFKKLKLPLNDKMKFVQKLVRLHLRPIALVKDEITDSAIRRLNYEAGEDLKSLMMLCKADITSANDKKVEKFLKNFEKLEQKLEEVEKKDQLRNFEPPVKGEDIMELFGIGPGRQIGDIKKEIREAILEGKIPNDREKALEYMKKVGEEKHGLEVKKEIE